MRFHGLPIMRANAIPKTKPTAGFTNGNRQTNSKVKSSAALRRLSISMMLLEKNWGGANSLH